MITEYQNQQPAVNVFPNGNGSNDIMSGNGLFWVIILFFFAMMMGWGNNGSAAGNNGGTTVVPYMMPMMNGYGGTSSMQQSFDQLALMNGINGVQASLAGAEVSRCNQQANLLATMNANQNANVAAMNSLAMGLQNCCCENRASIADLKYSIATENCADRTAINDALQALTVQNSVNTQRILDQMCADKIDAKNEKIAELQNQLNMANLSASQTAQTAAILSDNFAQTQALEQYMTRNNGSMCNNCPCGR